MRYDATVMHALPTPTLTGHSVALVPLQLGHGPSLWAAARMGRESYAFTWVPSSAQDADEYVRSALDEQQRGVSVPFAVTLPDGTVVGSTRFTAIEFWSWKSPPVDPVPRGPDGVEIGFTWYTERVQRTALNTEAKWLLLTYAFETWAVRRVMLKTDARNQRSRTAIARLGAQFDGVLRAAGPGADGTVRDTAYFSVLAREWPTLKLRLQERLANVK